MDINKLRMAPSGHLPRHIHIFGGVIDENDVKQQEFYILLYDGTEKENQKTANELMRRYNEFPQLTADYEARVQTAEREILCTTERLTRLVPERVVHWDYDGERSFCRECGEYQTCIESTTRATARYCRHCGGRFEPEATDGN